MTGPARRRGVRVLLAALLAVAAAALPSGPAAAVRDGGGAAPSPRSRHRDDPDRHRGGHVDRPVGAATRGRPHAHGPPDQRRVRPRGPAAGAGPPALARVHQPQLAGPVARGRSVQRPRYHGAHPGPRHPARPRQVDHRDAHRARRLDGPAALVVRLGRARGRRGAGGRRRRDPAAPGRGPDVRGLVPALAGQPDARERAGADHRSRAGSRRRRAGRRAHRDRWAAAQRPARHRRPPGGVLGDRPVAAADRRDGSAHADGDHHGHARREHPVARRPDPVRRRRAAAPSPTPTAAAGGSGRKHGGADPAWADAVVAAAAGREVDLLPWGDADVAALVHDGDIPLLNDAAERSASTAAELGLSGTRLPAAARRPAAGPGHRGARGRRPVRPSWWVPASCPTPRCSRTPRRTWRRWPPPRATPRCWSRTSGSPAR